MKFLVDANLPDAMVRWLSAPGDQAAYVDDLLPPGSLDGVIWDLARAQGMVVLSKDADFAVRARRERTLQVVWMRCGNLKLRALEAWFSARQAAMRRLLDAGEWLVELR